MSKYYIREVIVGENGRMVNCVAGEVLEDLHSYGDERAIVFIGYTPWYYSGHTITDDVNLKNWPEGSIKYLYYTTEGDFIK